MLYLKKYLMEGLVQAALLLSLCGVQVQVGLDPDLPPSLHELLLGQTSALTPARHRHLQDLRDPHPKSLDLDGFFTARRLLGWVHSLDRLQVPQAEVEAWLVQREPGPVPDLPSPLDRPADGIHRNLQVRAADQEEDEEEEETAVSLQECLRLLEDTCPFPEDQESGEAGDRREDEQRRPADRDPPLRPPRPSETSSMDMELRWQDLLSILEPEHAAAAMESPHQHWDQRSPGSGGGVGPEAAESSGVTQGLAAQSGFVGPPAVALLGLTPSAELEDHSPPPDTKPSLKNPDVLCSPPDHTDLLEEDPSEDLPPDDGPFEICLFAAEMPSCLPDVCPSSAHGEDQDRDRPASPPSVFLAEADAEEDLPLMDLLEDGSVLDQMRLLEAALEGGFSLEMEASLEEEGFLEHQPTREDRRGQDQAERHHEDTEKEADSDSGLSLDFSHSPASPCVSEASSSSSSSSCTSSSSYMSAGGSPFTEEEEEAEESSDMELEMRMKQEEEEEEVGAVGGGFAEQLFTFKPGNHKLLRRFPWMEHVGHDHTYPQARSDRLTSGHGGAAAARDGAVPSRRSLSQSKMWSRDERRARALGIPFSNQLIVNLPVEEFNDLLTKYRLNEDQLNLIKDIRRRGKNKIAAQNCRKRKLDVLLGLEEDVSGLRRYRSRLLREKEAALRNLQEMKLRLGTLYQEVLSRLRDERGRPLDAAEYLLHFGPQDAVTVAPRQNQAELPPTGRTGGKKPRDKRK